MDDATQTTDTQGIDKPLSPALTVKPGVDFPLPPANLRDALLNDPPGTKAKEQASNTAPVLALDYVDAPERTISLQHPFRLDGQVIETITVRALTVEETSALVRAKGATNLTTTDFYEAMTGVPADVIRSMRGRDGSDVTGAGWDFLPRWMTGEVEG